MLGKMSFMDTISKYLALLETNAFLHYDLIPSFLTVQDGILKFERF